MSHLVILSPSVYNPMGTCLECGAYKRVFHVEGFVEDAYCWTCLKPDWRFHQYGQTLPAERIAEMSQARQRHDVMKFVDGFKAHVVDPDGTRRDL